MIKHKQKHDRWKHTAERHRKSEAPESVNDHSLLSHAGSNRKLRKASQVAVHWGQPIELGLCGSALNPVDICAAAKPSGRTRLTPNGTKARPKTREVVTHRYGASLRAKARKLERTGGGL